ncbi:HupE/UreJ family protein [Myxococcota bacterium]|nr:HupE/UreJ family protein [Myxococcota bacterium]
MSRRHGTPRRAPRAALGTGALSLLLAGTVLAHSVGVSRGDYTLDGAVLSAELSFAKDELRERVPELDASADGDVDAAELERAGPFIERAILEPIIVRTPAGRCVGALSAVELAEQDGVTVRGRFDCGARTSSLTIELGFLATLAHGHRHLATATADGALAHTVAHAASTKLRLVATPATSASAAATSGDDMLTRGAAALAGAHAPELFLFVFALALAETRRRALVRAVAPATLAALAALALGRTTTWSPPASFVEPAVALALVYTGVDNLLVRRAPERTLAGVPLGLVFGLALARATSAASLDATVVAAIGLAVTTAAATAAGWGLQRTRWFGRDGTRLVSAVVAIAGAAWFVGRVG